MYTNRFVLAPIALFALLFSGCSQESTPKPGAAPAAKGSPSAPVQPKPAAAAVVDWNAVTVWTEDLRIGFLQFANNQYAEARQMGQAFTDKLASVAAERRPQAEAGLAELNAKAQALRMAIFRASEIAKEGTSEAFAEARKAIATARFEVFKVYEEVKADFE